MTGNKLKYLRLGILMLICLFLTPITVLADDNDDYDNNGYEETPTQIHPISVAPPVVQAELVGRLLRVTASAGFYEVESIYVNNRRFNHRVDSLLILDVGEYVALEQTISVYAVDFDGNRSNVVMLTPPPHAAPHTLTPEGDGIIIDNYLSEANMEFFTIQTATGNFFHMIVDRNRRFNNVYLLSPVNELDLIQMAQAAGIIMEPPAPEIILVEPLPAATPVPTPTPPPPAEPTGMNPIVRSLITLLVIVAVLGGVALAYYFLKIKGKGSQQSPDDDDDDDYDEDDFIKED